LSIEGEIDHCNDIYTPGQQAAAQETYREIYAD
jgi:hypothetical protein